MVGGKDGVVPDVSGADEDDESGEMTAIREDLRLGLRPGKKPWLLVVGGRRCLGMLIEVRPKMTIGRAPPVDVLLDEEGVSRTHAQIDILVGGVIRVTDLDSRNGILVGGRRVKSNALRDGDRLRLGEAVLTLVHVDEDVELFVSNLRTSIDALATSK